MLDEYMDTSVQERWSTSLKHTRSLRKRNHSDLTVLWLDLIPTEQYTTSQEM